MKTLHDYVTEGLEFQRNKHGLPDDYTARHIIGLDQYQFLQVISEALAQMEEDNQPVNDAPEAVSEPIKTEDDWAQVQYTEFRKWEDNTKTTFRWCAWIAAARNQQDEVKRIKDSLARKEQYVEYLLDCINASKVLKVDTQTEYEASQ